MKRIFIFVVIAVIAVALLLFTKDFIAKVIITKGMKAITGVGVSIAGASLDFRHASISLKDVKLYNPPGFKERLMAEVPEIYVDYCFASVCKGKAHFSYMRLDLKELIVVKNENSEINIHALKKLKPKRDVDADIAKKKKSRLQVDTFDLKVDKVLYIDYSEGSPPQERVYTVNVDERHSNINNFRGLTKLILAKALAKTTLNNIISLDFKALGQDASKALGKTATKAVEKTGAALKKILPLGE